MAKKNVIERSQILLSQIPGIFNGISTILGMLDYNPKALDEISHPFQAWNFLLLNTNKLEDECLITLWKHGTIR
ncbi:MAG: hypothetical protein WCP19_10120 [Chloroflexota bacterium]